MFFQEEAAFEDAFKDLLSSYSYESISAFFKASFLLPYKSNLSPCSLEKIIYVYGDENEVYTRAERDFIEDFEQTVFYYDSLCNSEDDRQVQCRLQSLIIDNNNDLLSTIAVMKIINKANEGFNFFVFWYNEGLRFGCSNFNSKYDCIISPLINQNVNIEMLYNTFLYRENGNQFYDLYYGYHRLINSIRECIDGIEKPLQYITYYSLDNNMFEDVRRFNMNRFLKTLPLENGEEQKCNLEFANSELACIQECFDELIFIKKNHINSLEMLFEAEESINNDNLEEYVNISLIDDESEEIENYDFIDDPILLLKKIEQEKNNDYLG